MTAWYDFFWTNPAAGTPPQLAVGLFSGRHLIFLAVCAVLEAGIIIGYRRASQAGRRHWRLGIALAVLALELFRQIGYWASGHYSAAIIPLHVCAIASFCVIIDGLRPNAWCRQYLYAMGSWAPICALLFADWAGQPWFNAYTWQAFLIHSLMWGYIMALLISGEFRPSWRQLWKAAVIVVVAAVTAWLVNRAWGTNFWFLNTGSPGSPLEPIQAASGPAYIPVMIVLVGLLWLVLYWPWTWRRHHDYSDSRLGLT
ncbi:MAG: TIGR02206 family membrane protein [Propionibacteriaceae bacterium]|jgi:hypothetical integral membrane protein (TIGR02206 family)|nr:TIGR02206 family membrane protein [Propionibacteriaceae bacterium]